MKRRPDFHFWLGRRLCQLWCSCLVSRSRLWSCNTTASRTFPWSLIEFHFILFPITVLTHKQNLPDWSSSSLRVDALNFRPITESNLLRYSVVLSGVSATFRVVKYSSYVDIKWLLVCCKRTLLSPSKVNNGSFESLSSPNLLAGLFFFY